MLRSVGSRAGTSKPELLARFRSWVFICANKNAASVAQTPLRLYAVKGTSFNPHRRARALEQRELTRLEKIHAWAVNPLFKSARSRTDNLAEVTNHPFLDLLAHPHDLISTMQLFEATVIGLDLVGESFWWHPLGPDGLPFAVVPLPATRVRPVMSDAGAEVERFEFVNWAGKLIEIPVEAISWFRTTNPEHPFCGLSWVEGVSGAIDRMAHYDAFEAALAENNGRPDMVFRYTEGKLTQPKRNDLERDIRKRLAGVGNAGQAIVMDGQFEIEKMGWSPKDMQNTKGREWTLMEIAAAAGIPFGLLSNKDFNKANMEASIDLWARHGIEPRLRRIESTISSMLRLYDPDGRMVAIFDSSVPEDHEFELRRDVEYLRAQVVTPNEIRAKRKLGPPLEGGDEVVKPPAPAPAPGEEPEPEPPEKPDPKKARA